MNLANKTKAELLEIIKQKENEIIDLKDELEEAEKHERYEHLTDEVKDNYDKLLNKGFKSEEALSLVETLISSGNIRIEPSKYNSYRRYY